MRWAPTVLKIRATSTERFKAYGCVEILERSARSDWLRKPDQRAVGFFRTAISYIIKNNIRLNFLCTLLLEMLTILEKMKEGKKKERNQTVVSNCAVKIPMLYVRSVPHTFHTALKCEVSCVRCTHSALMYKLVSFSHRNWNHPINRGEVTSASESINYNFRLNNLRVESWC